MKADDSAAVDTASLEKALESNRRLQSSILSELERLSRRKAENRREAAQLSDELFKELRSSEAENTMDALGNPYRRWNRFFFVDHFGSKPESNEDTVKRRKLEEKTFFCHTRPPFSNKESKALSKIAKELQETSVQQEVDYDEVAGLLEDQLKSDSDTNPKIELPRTAAECKIHFDSLSRKPPPFSKEEALKISEQVHIQDEYPDWQSIADSLPTDRSAWECFVAYQTKLRPVESRPWTLAEDEALLKYVAAMGPQFVVDGSQMMHAGTRLFPDKSKAQILTRVNHSLLNPNLVHDAWSDEEERKLAICMKVYSESSQDLYMASTHLPHRATKSVADKWQRSLNPEYSSRPFTKDEEEKLKQVLRVDRHLGWTEIARKHFPDRHPQRLLNRWSEIANDEDILARHGDALVRERTKRKSPLPVSKDATLNVDDYVVQIKKQPKY